jgi:hypothetical protein
MSVYIPNFIEVREKAGRVNSGLFVQKLKLLKIPKKKKLKYFFV